jgi:hypothetical protein
MIRSGVKEPGFPEVPSRRKRRGIPLIEEVGMPPGDKSAYTDKQKRQAAHIAAGYIRRGLSRRTAERRAWATINKIYGGGELSGFGRGKPVNRSVYRRAARRAARARARKRRT